MDETESTHSRFGTYLLNFPFGATASSVAVIDSKVATIATSGNTEWIRKPKTRAKPELSKGLLAGAAGGLIGAWTMIQFANGWSKLLGTGRIRLGTQEELDAASKVVDIVTRRVMHVHLRRPGKQRAETGFHYVFGALIGAGYGMLAELAPATTVAAGAPFGAVEWLFGNKLTAPRMRVIKPRAQYPSQERLQTFASHLIFGVAAELGRRSVRAQLRRDKG